MKTRIIKSGLNNDHKHELSLWGMKCQATYPRVGIFISDIWPVAIKKLLAGTPRGCWSHGYIKLLRGTDRTGPQAAQMQGFLFGRKKNFTDSFSFCQRLPPKNSCALFFQLYTALCLICPHLIHLPPIFLSPLQGAIPLEGEGTISSPWVDNPLSAHLQGIMQATSLPTCSVVAIWSA